MCRKLLSVLIFLALFSLGLISSKYLRGLGRNYVVSTSTPSTSFFGKLETSLPVEPVKTDLILGGDVMLGRSVMTASLDSGNLFYPFVNISDYLNSADLVFVNLESPIVGNCPRIVGGYKFCTLPEIAAGLKKSGVNIVNIANNHTYNFGKDGFEATKKYLQDFGIKYVGDDNFVVKEMNGIRFGFVGFDFVSKIPGENDYELIKMAKSQCDVLVAGVHWGDEYFFKPNEFQKITAQKMVEAGVDIISGHHPHWVQEIGEINGKKVYYSLGNLIFDQMWSEETKRGILVRLEYDGKSIVGETKTSTYIEKIGQPKILD